MPQATLRSIDFERDAVPRVRPDIPNESALKHPVLTLDAEQLGVNHGLLVELDAVDFDGMFFHGVLQDRDVV